VAVHGDVVYVLTAHDGGSIQGCRERSSPGVAGVAVLYLAGTLAAQGNGAASAARPTMRGRSQRSPVSGAEAVQRGTLLLLMGIPVYVRAAHGGAPRGTDRGNDEH
jgi:hypothetical protein